MPLIRLLSRFPRIALQLLVLLPIYIAASASASEFKLSLESEAGRNLSNLPENSWVKLNLNDFPDAWTPLGLRPKPPEASSVGSPASILGAWSSMAWDSKRGKLIFWGGGHANYPGNDIYTWAAGDSLWHRGSLPSEVAFISGNKFEAIDGPFNAPISAHTYDSSEYLPIIDRFLVFGGAAFNTGRYFELQDGSRTGPYMWDPAKANPDYVGGTTGSNVEPNTYGFKTGGKMWQNRDNLQPQFSGDLKPGYGGAYFINAVSAYTSEGGKDVLYIQASSELYKYTVHDISDAGLDTYEQIGRYIYSPFTGQGTGSFDPVRQVFLRTANSTFTYWHVDTPDNRNENIIFTPVVEGGTFDFANMKYFAMDYDPVRDHFVIWTGQADTWSLTPPADLQTGNWVLRPLSASIATGPSLLPGTHTGILGKWKYAAGLDVFLGAYESRVGQIWAYKPANWQPDLVENLPFIVSPANGSSFSLGSDVSITIDSLEPSVVGVEVFANGSSIGVSDTLPFTLSWLTPPGGVYSLEAVANEAGGISRTSTTVSITVLGAQNLLPTVDITSPADGASYIEGDSIGLSATADDADGSVVKVEFFQGGTKLGEDLTAPWDFLWINPAVGDYSVTAVATDNVGGTTTSTTIALTVEANASNVAPTVAMASPVDGSVYTEGDTVELGATASDADGSVVKVEFYQGAIKLGEDTVAPYSYSWLNTVPGNYTLTAVATDDIGATATSTAVSITVDAASGGGGSGQSVTLQEGLGGYSGTRDAYIYEYHHGANFGARAYLTDKPTGSRDRVFMRFAIFQSEGGPVPDGATITSATLNMYKYSAYDHRYRIHPMLVDWAEGEITWDRARVGVPWSSPGGTGVGTDYGVDADGEGSVGWSGGWASFDLTGGVQAMSLGRSNYGWTLVAAGGNGNSKRYHSSEATDASLRPELVIEYSDSGAPANIKPTVDITSPVDGASYIEGDSIGLSATADDADGSVVKVEFFQGGTKLGEDLTAPWDFLWINPAVGDYSVTAVATDNVGGTTTSTTIALTVEANASNVAPTVAMASPVDGSVYTEGDTVELGATASDADGSVVKVEFYQGAIKLGEDTVAPYSYSWLNTVPGNYTLTAVATDDIGATATSTAVSITVDAASGGGGSGQSVTLQEGLGGYSGTRDAYIYEYHHGANFGARAYLTDKPTGSRDRVFMRFAIFQSEGGPVPDGATITSATLNMYKYSAYDHRYRIHPMLVDWAEGEITWDRARVGVPWSSPGGTGVGTDYGVDADGEGSVGWSGGWASFDLTGGVQAMSLGRSNYGWTLVAAGGNGNSKRYHSSEATDASLRPELVVEYE